MLRPIVVEAVFDVLGFSLLIRIASPAQFAQVARERQYSLSSSSSATVPSLLSAAACVPGPAGYHAANGSSWRAGPLCTCVCVRVQARACFRAWVMACVVHSHSSAHAHTCTRRHRFNARAWGRVASGYVVVRIARRESRAQTLATNRLGPGSYVASDSPSPQHTAQQHPLPLRTRVQAFQSASALALLPLPNPTFSCPPLVSLA